MTEENTTNEPDVINASQLVAKYDVALAELKHIFAKAITDGKHGYWTKPDPEIVALLALESQMQFLNCLTAAIVQATPAGAQVAAKIPGEHWHPMAAFFKECAQAEAIVPTGSRL